MCMIKPKILIVDDDARLSTLMATILERAGYETRQENRSFAALSTAQKFQPDLILLDLNMPGKDGGTVAAEIRMEKPLSQTPIIFVTSLIGKSEAGICGGDRFLSKPIEPAVLLAAVKQTVSMVAA